jgi:hypothetical protein
MNYFLKLLTITLSVLFLGLLILGLLKSMDGDYFANNTWNAIGTILGLSALVYVTIQGIKELWKA